MNIYVWVLMLLMLGAAGARAQEKPLAGELPVAYGPSNMGRDFWLAFPANWDEWESSKYYIRLYITSKVRTSVTVRAGATFSKTLLTIPNEFITVDLTPQEAQMFLRRDDPDLPQDRVYKGRAVHVQADAPVAVYGMNHTVYSSDGLLALPTSALGREYIVAAYGAFIGTTRELPSQYMIIAPYNGTKVTIHHPHRTPNHAIDETFTIELDSGDVWSAMTVGYGGDMTGVVIKSTKPVAVTAGLACANLPNLRTYCCCDHLTEMMIPTESWGKVYHAVPFSTRVKGDIYRILAKEPDTKVYINGTLHTTLKAVGGQESTGWFEYYAGNKNAQEFTADKPIQVIQYNPSRHYDNVLLDPFYMVLTPLEQYRTEGVFCTPSNDFPKNFLSIVCDKEDVYDLEITRAGRNAWEPFWSKDDVAPQDLASAIDGRNYVGVTAALVPGTYQLRARRPFAGYIYGYSEYNSYGYPIWAGMNNLTMADTKAPDIRKNQTCGGAVDATVTDRPDNAGARSNLAMIELDADASLNYALDVTSFQPGMAVETSYNLTVTDKRAPARAVVIMSDMAGNITLDTVIYNPVLLTTTPRALDFGSVRSGGTPAQSITLVNESAISVELQEILLKDKAQGFRVLSPTGPVVLGPKNSPTASVEVRLGYTADVLRPGALQTYQDSLGFRDMCGVNYLLPVRAAIVKPVIRVTDHDFGRLAVGKESHPGWELEVWNMSPIAGSMLTVTSMRGPDNSSGVEIFDVKSGSALEFPFTLAPNQARFLLMTATAPGVGHYADTIFFTSDAMGEDNDSAGYLRVEGIGPSSVDGAVDGEVIGAMEILPNPAGGENAVLEYSIARSARVAIELMNMNGRVLRTVQESVLKEAGTHQVMLDLSGLAAGTYFARIINGDEQRVQRFVVVQ